MPPIGKSVNRSIGPSVNPIINPKSKIENTQSVNRTIGKSVNPHPSLPCTTSSAMPSPPGPPPKIRPWGQTPWTKSDPTPRNFCQNMVKYLPFSAKSSPHIRPWGQTPWTKSKRNLTMNRPNHKSKIENSPPPSPHPIPIADIYLYSPITFPITIASRMPRRYRGSLSGVIGGEKILFNRALWG